LLEHALANEGEYMANASLLNDNLAHKITLALLQEGIILPESYGQTAARVLQITEEVRTSGLALEGAAGLTAQDALTIVAGNTGATGTYQNHPKLVPTFQKGIRAVHDAIHAELAAGQRRFEQAYEAAKRTLDSLRPTEYTLEAAAVHEGALDAFLLLGLAARHGFTDKRVLDAYHRGSAALTAPAVSENASTVSEERGEELMADLEEGIASPVAEDLRSRILAGDKAGALEVLAEERMTGQDAEDLYAYCRQQWLGKRLALLEVPSEQMEDVVRKNLPSTEVFDGYGPRYLVRQGKSVESGYAEERGGRLWLALRRDRVELSTVPQLWMVVEVPQ
jgi:hypothetical protein